MFEDFLPKIESSEADWKVWVAISGFSGGASGRFLDVFIMLFEQFSVNLSNEISMTKSVKPFSKGLKPSITSFKLSNKPVSLGCHTFSFVSLWAGPPQA